MFSGFSGLQNSFTTGRNHEQDHNLLGDGSCSWKFKVRVGIVIPMNPNSIKKGCKHVFSSNQHKWFGCLRWEWALHFSRYTKLLSPTPPPVFFLFFAICTSNAIVAETALSWMKGYNYTGCPNPPGTMKSPHSLHPARNKHETPTFRTIYGRGWRAVKDNMMFCNQHLMENTKTSSDRMFELKHS